MNDLINLQIMLDYWRATRTKYVGEQYGDGIELACLLDDQSPPVRRRPQLYVVKPCQP